MSDMGSSCVRGLRSASVDDEEGLKVRLAAAGEGAEEGGKAASSSLPELISTSSGQRRGAALVWPPAGATYLGVKIVPIHPLSALVWKVEWRHTAHHSAGATPSRPNWPGAP